MAAPPFFLAFTIVDARPLDAMLHDVTASVLKRVGYGSPAIEDILGTLREAAGQGAADGLCECRAEFRTEAGALIIAVSFVDGRQWRATRPLPPPD